MPESPSRPRHHWIVDRWIIYSGRCHGLISRDTVRDHPKLVSKSEKPITFNIASGQAPSTEKAILGVKELEQLVQEWVMQRSFALLSLSWRFAEGGFDFIWPHGSTLVYRPGW